jgi:MFS family permease
VVETGTDRRSEPPPPPGEAKRAGQVLAVTMLAAGLIYQATQAALPKLLALRLGDGGIVAVSMAVSAIYLVAGLAQVVAGHLADRHSPKRVYLGAALIQMPLLALMATVSGLPLVAVTALAVTANLSGIPAENLLVARAAPARWRGTAFGFKYVLGFGVASLAVPLVASLGGTTRGLGTLFVLLAALAAVIVLAGQLLPGAPKPVPAPAE